MINTPPDFMRCILIDANHQLTIVKEKIPAINDHQVLVKVKAIALNRADLMQRQGKYPPPPGESAIPGLEAAGEVVAIGAKVTRFKPGDTIYGLVGSGAYAEYCPIHQLLAEKMPPDWSFEYAAAIPEALTTANATLFELGNLSSQETMLVHAAGSGITTMAIQMAKLTQVNVLTTASNSSKAEQAIGLGATQVINYRQEDFAELIASDSLDLVLDYMGGEYFNKHLKLLKPSGRLIQIASMLGRNVELDLTTLMRKRLKIEGFVLRSQSITEKIYLWQAAHKRWGFALQSRALKPVIDSIFQFSEIEKAQQHMLDGKHFGKIVISL
ncbi:quinone oxidoreductase [Legionella quinlivanii]|uniref:Quinone oxidoreductase n=1 Tax=Legionella quinlivanii TaxID=45073 RepID=A0A0W0Y4T2_9GAMM|nr:NAD(P)H-quinone oxidoreductase [Legionella quinlivanii]KTD51744.1 quinone oxidoreductase [Legionella quinlivanii]SEF64954.1 putative NAD(P)H quinone oxidoreductase, PIG3 family [Legionella quinlivanii DSM 21216]STY10728.1 quinone oxidoreductase [Legionella quinlivanii]